ncbi:MAG: Hpt domain-containing protein [Vallitaleaceae bacterium]|nr:Hpt domain-containing protein [Vallitaleaceae bacterium]
MDSMIQSYMEETDDMLQRAEECIIRLEMEYSETDVNELFRIAHTIKGSSHMVGYEDIGNLMHKIEDMLDCARNGTILFDQSIVSLCFEGLDIVKKMLQYKKEEGSAEIMENLVAASLRIDQMIEVFIRVNKKEDTIMVAQEPEIGIISSRIGKQAEGKNTYYISFFFEEDVPMVSPVLLMILNSVEDIGTLVYSSVGDHYFSGISADADLKTYEIIISTDKDEVELYTYFALFYIEKINIVDLSRNKLEDKDFSFQDHDDILFVSVAKAFIMLYKIIFRDEVQISSEALERMKALHKQALHSFAQMKSKEAIDRFTNDFMDLYAKVILTVNDAAATDERQRIREQNQKCIVKLLERAYNFSKGKYVFSIFKPEGSNFISKLRNFTDMLNKSSILVLLIDLSNLTILDENEVKALILIKKQMQTQEIEIGIVAEGKNASRITNIFDSIKQVEEFYFFKSYLSAILGIMNSEYSFQGISKQVEDVQHE